MLADFVSWTVAVVIFFAVGFFGIAVAIVATIIGAVRRILGWSGSGSADQVPVPPPPPAGRVCPHPRCGNRNRADAVYCSRCGRPLRRTCELDAYG